jgi:replicative DNA helicase
MIDVFAGGLRPMKYWTHKAKEKTAFWKQGIPEGRSTGFLAINKYLRLVGGEFTLVAARPSMGKTSMGMQMVETVAKNLRDDGEDGVAAVFSAEMSGVSLVHRMASALCGVNLHDMRQGRGKLDEITLLEEQIEHLEELPIYIDDNSGPTTAQMLEELSLVNESMPVKMMLFDFLELGGDRAKDENLRISEIAKNLKAIAKTLDIPVIGLSQLSRNVEERANKMPNLSDLRYSGMLEQIADNVLFIMRPEYYLERGQEMKVPDADRKGIAYVQVAKQRNGPVGLCRMMFDGSRTRFGDLRI